MVLGQRVSTAGGLLSHRCRWILYRPAVSQRGKTHVRGIVVVHFGARRGASGLPNACSPFPKTLAPMQPICASIRASRQNLTGPCLVRRVLLSMKEHPWPLTRSLHIQQRALHEPTRIGALGENIRLVPVNARLVDGQFTHPIFRRSASCAACSA